MRIKDLSESTVAGSIASVAKPLGEIQKRSRPEKAPKVAKAKKYANVISEGKMKDLAYDLEHLDAGNFMKKYGKPKDYFTKKVGNTPVSEAELQEDDLILVPGQIRKKDKSFIPHDKDRRDHEVEMARKELYAAAKDAMRILKQIQSRSEDEGLMGWQQSYITLASDYLNSVADSLAHVPGTNEMTGGVLAGGMSNFEEGRYYNPLDHERREQDAMDQERRDFKRREMEYELRNEPKNNYQVSIDGRAWKVFADKAHAEAVARKLRAKGKKAEVHITGASVSEAKDDTSTHLTAGPKFANFFNQDNPPPGKVAAILDAPEFKQVLATVLSDKRLKDDFEKIFMLAKDKVPTSMYQASIKDLEKKEKKKDDKGTVTEKKDACYSKVKSRYKVWPSAYASGALSKCRKVGASNWGNKSKK